MADVAENKVEYGLRNAHYAMATYDETTRKMTFDTPVRIQGAVSLSLDPSGETVKFKADDIDYYMNNNNQGYEGTLTVARATDKFKQDVLGEEKTTDGVLLENADAQIKHFALLFEFQGDKKAIRHALYYCTASRVSESSKTKEDGNPNTTDIKITASPRPDNMLVKARTTPGIEGATYDGWYKAVYEKTTEVAEV